jgi:hypothetical protein
MIAAGYDRPQTARPVTPLAPPGSGVHARNRQAFSHPWGSNSFSLAGLAVATIPFAFNLAGGRALENQNPQSLT